jgi:hypothetical protein
MSKHHPRVSVAASAIVRHLIGGGWLGASYPWYIKACRPLRGGEFTAALRLANFRLYGGLARLNRRNFEAADES